MDGEATLGLNLCGAGSTADQKQPLQPPGRLDCSHNHRGANVLLKYRCAQKLGGQFSVSDLSLVRILYLGTVGR